MNISAGGCLTNRQSIILFAQLKFFQSIKDRRAPRTNSNKQTIHEFTNYFFLLLFAYIHNNKPRNFTKKTFTDNKLVPVGVPYYFCDL